jgi:hypothetical protein
MDERGTFSRSTRNIPIPQNDHPSPVCALLTNPERLRQPSGGKMKTRSDSKGRNRSSTVFVILILSFLALMMSEGASAAGESLTLDEDGHEEQP